MLEAFDDLHQILSYMAAVLTIGLAFVLGRGPERACALIMLAEYIVDIAMASWIDPSVRWWMTHIKAVLILTVYGAVVWRWPNRWLILLMGLQGFAVMLHLSTWLDATLLMSSHRLLLNGVGWLMAIVLATATIGGALKRYDALRSARRG